MTFEAGIDCFVVYRCSETGDGCSVAGSSAPVAVRTDYPITVFIDKDYYVWVRVFQYAVNASNAVIPFWIQVYKSIEPIDCESVIAAGETGYRPTGPGSTEWLVLECEGLHQDWSDSACDSTATPPIFDLAFLALTFYPSSYHCCSDIADPCNPPLPGYCPPITPTCCDGPGTTYMAVELSGIAAYTPPFSGGVLGTCDRCPDLNGTFILGPMRYQEGTGDEVCIWEYCELIPNFCPDVSTAYQRLIITLQVEFSAWTLTVVVDGGTDCDDLTIAFPALTVAVYSGPTYSLPDISPCTVEDYELTLGSTSNYVCDVSASTCLISNV